MASYIYVKNPNGTTYVYENISYWNKATKRTEHKRKCLGHLDPDSGEIIANRKRCDSNADNLYKNCDIYSCGISLLMGKAAAEAMFDISL